MRGLLRTLWFMAMVGLYFLFVRTFLYKDTTFTGPRYDLVISGTPITFSQPFRLEAGHCDYFILKGPQGKTVLANPIDEPLGVSCIGNLYFTAVEKEASAGDWKAEEGFADLRISSLDGKSVNATIPNDDSSDRITSIVFILSGILVTVLFFMFTNAVSKDWPAWLKPKQRSSDQRSRN